MRQLRDLSVEQIAVASSMGAVASCALNVAAGCLAKLCSERGAKRLVNHARKLAIFAIQEEVRTRRYHLLVSKLAAIAFSTFALSALFFIYSKLATLLLTLILVLSVATYAAARVHREFAE